MNIKKNLTSIALALILMGGNSTALYADDTDIYLAPPNVLRDDAPNVLLILDNSGSMETNSIDTKDPYNPLADYSGKGKSSSDLSPFDDNLIYWAAKDEKPVKAGGSGENKWFSGTGKAVQTITAANLKCDTAKPFLAYAASAPGLVGGLTLTMWTAGKGTKYNWAPMAAGDREVECRSDGALTGQYPNKSDGANNPDTSPKYSTDPDIQITWSALGTEGITLYSGKWLNWDYASSSTTPAAWQIPETSRTRMEIARDAVRNIVNTTTNLNLGLMVFNHNSSVPHGGRVVNRIRGITAGNRAAILNSIDQVSGYVNGSSGQNYTPLAETMYEAYQYLRGGDVTYGGVKSINDSGGISGTDRGSSDIKYPRPYPDICAENISVPAYCAENYVYQSTGGTRIDTLNKSSTGYYQQLGYTSNSGTYLSPFKYQCQQAYIIIVTDGDPSNDSAANTAIKNLVDADPLAPYPTPDAEALGKAASGTLKPTYDLTNTSKTIVADGNTENSRLDDLAGYMYNNDIVPNGTLDGKQRVVTFTISFGDGIKESGKYLLKMTAEAGHGRYLSALSAAELSSSLTAALSDIAQHTSSFAAPSLSVNAFNKLFNRDEIYFALFQPSSTVKWDGNIKKLRLCSQADIDATPTGTTPCSFGQIIDANGVAAIDDANLRIKDTSVSFWNSVQDGGDVTNGGVGLATQNGGAGSANRKVYSYLGAYSAITTSNNVVQLTDDFVAASNTIYTAAVSNKTLLDSANTLVTDTDVQNVVHWMLGKKLDNTTARWPMADPLHSRPVALTLGANGGDKNDPVIKLFVATNDGSIHIINDSTGRIEWSFIPKEFLSNMKTLMTDADGIHKYGADGSPTFWIVDHNNDGILDPAASPADQAYMFVGMRRGGRNIFAFNLLANTSSAITAHTTALSPKLAWVIEGGVTTGFNRLGQTWSSPQVRKIRMKCNGTGCATDDSVSRDVLIFGGGYDTAQDTGDFTAAASTGPYVNQSSGVGNAVYIVNPLDGSLIWWASSDAGATLPLTEMVYAIPSDLSLFDSNGDGAVDRLFFGDMGGLVWRVDLSTQLDVGSNGSAAEQSKGYVFADLVCLRNASNARVCNDTSVTTIQSWRKVFYNPDIAQVRDSVFSAIPDYDAIVVATGNRADPVDKHSIQAKKEAVHNRIYLLRDTNIGTGPYGGATPPVALTQANLTPLSTNPLQDPSNTAVYDPALADIRTKKGWWIELEEPASKAVIVPPHTTATTWVGEKALAKPVIFDNVVYVTTYTPANTSTSTVTCASTEGLGKIWGLGLYDATAVVDFDGDGNPDRSNTVGGGIPSELVTVIREGGVTGLVGTSGGAANPNIGEELPRGKTYWYEE